MIVALAWGGVMLAWAAVVAGTLVSLRRDPIFLAASRYLDPLDAFEVAFYVRTSRRNGLPSAFARTPPTDATLSTKSIVTSVVVSIEFLLFAAKFVYGRYEKRKAKRAAAAADDDAKGGGETKPPKNAIADAVTESEKLEVKEDKGQPLTDAERASDAEARIQGAIDYQRSGEDYRRRANAAVARFDIAERNYNRVIAGNADENSAEANEARDKVEKARREANESFAEAVADGVGGEGGGEEGRGE